MEVRGKKVYIYLKNELTRTESTTTVDKTEFEICVEKHKELGSSDPVKFAIFDYIIKGHCIMPITTSDKIKQFLDKILGHRRDDLHDKYYSYS
jgi:hypothetical protein